MNFSSKRIASLTSIKAIQSVVTSMRPGILSFFHNGTKIFMNSLIFIWISQYIFSKIIFSIECFRKYNFKINFAPILPWVSPGTPFHLNIAEKIRLHSHLHAWANHGTCFRQANVTVSTHLPPLFYTPHCCQKWRSCLLSESS